MLKQYLISYIITEPSKDIFHAMLAKIGFTAHPKVRVCNCVSNEIHENVF